MTSPTVARWELSRRLSTRRKDLGLRVDAVTERLDFSRNYWSAVENDRTLIAREKLELLLDLFEFEEPDRTELLELREASRVRGWWETRPGVTDTGKRMFGLEAGAERIRTFESNLMPGMLQTAEYAKAVLTTDPFFSPVDVDDVTAARMRRKEILTRPNPVEFFAIVSEASLLQEMGGVEVQIRQLEHVAELIERHDSIEFRISPFKSNPGILLHSSTILYMDFDSAHLPTIIWQEAVRALGVVDDVEQHRRLELAWDLCRDRCMDRQQSVDLIHETIDRLKV